jgi:hypothetical protein
MTGHDTREALNHHQLAGLADCADPDGPNSPGAKFLRSVAHSVAEGIAYGTDLEDLVWETADSCVPIYTHELWLTFVDLCAYREDIENNTGDSDMEHQARIALYQIGERLAQALVEVSA